MTALNLSPRRAIVPGAAGWSPAIRIRMSDVVITPSVGPAPAAAAPARSFIGHAKGIGSLTLVSRLLVPVGEAVIWTWITLRPSMWLDLLLTLKLTVIMLPYVLLICGGAFLSRILQVHHRFAAPAAAPIILNVCHILVLGIGGAILGLGHKLPEAQAIGPQTMIDYAAAFVVLVAGVM